MNALAARKLANTKSPERILKEYATIMSLIEERASDGKYVLDLPHGATYYAETFNKLMNEGYRVSRKEDKRTIRVSWMED